MKSRRKVTFLVTFFSSLKKKGVYALQTHFFGVPRAGIEPALALRRTGF